MHVYQLHFEGSTAISTQTETHSCIKSSILTNKPLTKSEGVHDELLITGLNADLVRVLVCLRMKTEIQVR